MSEAEHVDVLIIGAGLSGVGAAAQLTREHPGRSYLVLERREASGGTWDLFRYPGIRSDSDMYTLGYRFKPWRADTALADGPAILDYVRETAREYDVESHIRYSHRVTRADWDSATAPWSVEVETPRARAASPPRSCGRAAATTTTTRATRPSCPASTATRGSSSTRSSGPRTSTTAASASW